MSQLLLQYTMEKWININGCLEFQLKMNTSIDDIESMLDSALKNQRWMPLIDSQNISKFIFSHEGGKESNRMIIIMKKFIYQQTVPPGEYDKNVWSKFTS